MKSRDVYRSVRPQSYMRSTGDAPTLGKVARLRGPGGPRTGLWKKRRRKGPSSNSRKPVKDRYRRKVVLTWTAVLGLMMMGVLMVFFWSWLKPQMNQEHKSASPVAVIKHKASAFVSPTEDAALELVRLGLAVRDPGEVEKYFRLGSSTPEAVIAFLEGMEELDGAVTALQWMGSMDANDMLLEGVAVNTLKADSPRNRLALLTPDQRGVWKIDFEAFARKVEPSWEQLVSPEGGTGTVRVMMARDSYYNGPFMDDRQWMCYGMASPDNKVILLGYCRRHSPQALAMERIIQTYEEKRSQTRTPPRVTLSVKRPEGADSRQFEITGVLAEDWVLGDKSFDAAPQ